MILAIIFYIIYIAFWGRIISHALIWFKATKQPAAGIYKTTPVVYVAGALDIILFRRLFNTDKLLWIGSWTFHISFLLVVSRHLRYFMTPVPDCIRFMQPPGIIAGYLLPLSVVCILAARLARAEKYVSGYNYCILTMVLLIGLTGLAMRLFYRPDPVEVKGFISGIMTFKHVEAPGGFLFIIHFLSAIFLLPYLPLHILAAPVVTLEARRREEGLKGLMH